jgi:hypothetical protein
LTKFSKNNNIFKSSIEPGLIYLSNICKINGSTDLEKIIQEKAILCFWYLLNNAKNYNLFAQNEKIFEEIIQFNLINILIENLYFNFKDYIHKAYNEKSGRMSNESVLISLKIFELLSNINLTNTSYTLGEYILNNNILDVLFMILSTEFANISERQNLYLETYSFIFNLLPKIQFNKVHLDFFSLKILNCLITNFISQSSTNTSIKILKLINLHLHISKPEEIDKYYYGLNNNSENINIIHIIASKCLFIFLFRTFRLK